MSRETTDDDVAFLVGRVSRIAAGIIQAHAEGYGPPDSAGQSVLDIVSALLNTSILDASRQLAKDVNAHYLSVYRYMVVRGSPEGVEVQWLRTADLFRAVGDAYANVTSQSANGEEADDQRESLRAVKHGRDRIRLIAAVVDTETASQAHTTLTAIVTALDRGSATSPLTDDDRELLHLLVSGNTVEGIAGQLDVSTRTIHRRLQAVWDQVGASSRTEGIAIVSARGWLD